jgi:phosphoribosyl 1,2-cyclic phosphodiesterase
MDMGNVIPVHHWFREINQSSRWEVGKIQCESFAVEHDTGEPLGFAVQVGKVRAAFALDLGVLGGDLADYIADSDLVLLEANHDPDMLRAGPYAYKLKERILKTHLSNEAACAWISEHMTHRTQYLLLGHLSLSTNDPELVRLMARRELDRLKLGAMLEVIEPGAASGPWVLTSPCPSR